MVFLDKSLSFIKSVLSDNGVGSSTRVNVTMLVVFIVGAGTALMFKLHTPVTVSDINSFLSSAGQFLALTTGTLYGINRAASSVDKFGTSDRADHSDRPDHRDGIQ